MSDRAFWAWVRYYAVTEAFDLHFCSGRNEYGQGMPIDSFERMRSDEFAREQNKLLRTLLEGCEDDRRSRVDAQFMTLEAQIRYLQQPGVPPLSTLKFQDIAVGETFIAFPVDGSSPAGSYVFIKMTDISAKRVKDGEFIDMQAEMPIVKVLW